MPIVSGREDLIRSIGGGMQECLAQPPLNRQVSVGSCTRTIRGVIRGQGSQAIQSYSKRATLLAHQSSPQTDSLAGAARRRQHEAPSDLDL